MSAPKSKLEELIEAMYKVHTPRTSIIYTGAEGMKILDKVFKEVIKETYPLNDVITHDEESKDQV